MGSTKALIVFARLPVPGRVKTRLAAGVGQEGACRFYEACLKHTLHQAARCPGCRLYVYHSNGDRTADMQQWIRTHCPGLSVQVQDAVRAQHPSPDLGDKLFHALSEVHEQGCQQVAVIGSDIPGICVQVLAEAFAALQNSEAVLGPAADGGYYLLGLTRVDPGLFRGVSWSTSAVLDETLQRAAAAQLRVAPLEALPVLQDIDTVEDLASWMCSITLAHCVGDALKGPPGPSVADPDIRDSHFAPCPDGDQPATRSGKVPGDGDEQAQRLGSAGWQRSNVWGWHEQSGVTGDAGAEPVETLASGSQAATGEGAACCVHYQMLLDVSSALILQQRTSVTPSICLRWCWRIVPDLAHIILVGIVFVGQQPQHSHTQARRAAPAMLGSRLGPAFGDGATLCVAATAA